MKSVIFILSVLVSSGVNAQNSNRTHVVNGKVVEPVDATKAVSQGDTESGAEGSQSASKWPNITDRLAFLSDGTFCVMLPKGAVVNLPANGRITLHDKAVGEWIEWDEFFQRNRNALRLEPVSFNQMQGLESIKPELLSKIKAEKIPVLTSYNNKVIAMPAAYLNPPKP